VRERDFRLVADTVINLSRDGVLVAPAEAVLTGEKVVLSFASPAGADWIDAEATVARVIHGRRPGEFQRCLGLSFDRLDESSRQALNRTLMFAPPSPPGAPRHDIPEDGDNEAFPLLRKVAGRNAFWSARHSQSEIRRKLVLQPLPTLLHPNRATSKAFCFSSLP
jgi:hypothetical protein